MYRRTNVVRRRVRKDAAEEEKCKSVAQLLMQGKSGEELAEEIKENGTKTVAKGVRYVPLLYILNKADGLEGHRQKRARRMSFRKALSELSGHKRDKADRAKIRTYLDRSREQSAPILC